MLMADKMRLADFVAELTRYRRGFVRCDPAIADLRISGAFPISDTQRTLNMLTQTYPVLVTGHLSGYWVTLSAA
jgi:transmembrane sensor